MVRQKKKYESGAATTYIARNQALKRLQLNLKDFRRLCILKGIYPHEPKNKKKVGKGSTAPRTYYHLKDIQFLAHEPIVYKFREFKIFVRKLKKATAKRDRSQADSLRKTKPKYKLDKIVKERYPHFTDAIRDLDDCLSMCFLFCTFPKTRKTPDELIRLCKKLTIEFMHYVMASKSLKKVFISIKGIYYQAEVMGQTITWITPHQRSHSHPDEVDYRIMCTFVEFYTTMLGFINYRLFQTLNLFYPPKLDIDVTVNDGDLCLPIEASGEYISSLTKTLKSVLSDPEGEEVMDDIPNLNDDPEQVNEAKLEFDKSVKFHKLFENLKFFLNREVPREAVTFIIRSFGGQVSWCKTDAMGSTYDETDETITHHIVDRPTMTNQYLSRFYIQPQWVFDCINFQKLLPVEDYFIGAELPPHLSPFVEEKEGDYVPPDKEKMLNPATRKPEVDVESEDEEQDEEDQEEEGAEDYVEEDDEEEESNEEDDEDEDNEEEDNKGHTKKRKLEAAKLKNTKIQKMSVKSGSIEQVDHDKMKSRQQNEERKLAEMMIPKKKKRLYSKIMYKKKKEGQEKRKLEEKREKYDLEQKQAKKKKAKQ